MKIIDVQWWIKQVNDNGFSVIQNLNIDKIEKAAVVLTQVKNKLDFAEWYRECYFLMPDHIQSYLGCSYKSPNEIFKSAIDYREIFKGLVGMLEVYLDRDNMLTAFHQIKKILSQYRDEQEASDTIIKMLQALQKKDE